MGVWAGIAPIWGCALCASRMIPNPSLKGSRATILVVPDLEPLPAAREVGDCSTLILGGFVLRISFHVLDILHFVSVLVVAESADVWFVVQKLAQLGQFVRIPTHGISDGLVPQAAHVALAVLELGYNHALGALPAVGENALDSGVFNVGDAEILNGSGVVLRKGYFSPCISQQLKAASRRVDENSDGFCCLCVRPCDG